MNSSLHKRLSRPPSTPHQVPLSVRAPASSKAIQAAALRLQIAPSAEGRNQPKWVHQNFLAGTAASLVILAAGPSTASDAAATFANRCAGCHSGGGNVVQGGATLQAGDLSRNGFDSPGAMYDLIYAGKGKMPGFGEGCTPKGKCTFAARLSDEEVKEQVRFVLEQAANGWR